MSQTKEQHETIPPDSTEDQVRLWRRVGKEALEQEQYSRAYKAFKRAFEQLSAPPVSKGT